MRTLLSEIFDEIDSLISRANNLLRNTKINSVILREENDTYKKIERLIYTDISASYFVFRIFNHAYIKIIDIILDYKIINESDKKITTPIIQEQKISSHKHSYSEDHIRCILTGYYADDIDKKIFKISVNTNYISNKNKSE